MADLTGAEKRGFERVLAMGGGYVLNFSNRTFHEFVLDSTGRDIYEKRYVRTPVENSRFPTMFRVADCRGQILLFASRPTFCRLCAISGENHRSNGEGG